MKLIKKIGVIFVLLAVLISPMSIFAQYLRAEDADEINFPLDEPVTLELATPDWADGLNLSDTVVFQKMKELTGVEIVWQTIPRNQYSEIMSLRISSGGDQLADIINMPTGANLPQLANNDIIIPLNNLLEKHGEHINALYDKYPIYKVQTTASDGNMYTVHPFGFSSGYPYAFVIRKDWLDNLGLDSPETIEDWENVLTAFKNEDADGDGDPTNEVPFGAAGHVWYLTVFGHAWGLHLFYSDGYYPNSEGQMEFEFTTDRAKEFYTWLNKLYSEGLIDPEFLTIGTEDALAAKAAQGIIGSFSTWPAQCINLTKSLQEGGQDGASFISTIPPKGPYDQLMEHVGNMGVNGYAISTKCEHPDVAVKWIDFLFSDDGMRLTNIGVEGETYEVVDGEVKMLDVITDNPNGLSYGEALLQFGANSNNMLPGVRTDAFVEPEPSENPELEEILEDVAERSQPYLKPQLVLPPMTTEQADSLANVGSDLMTYVWETLGQYVVGTKDIESDWDTFVTTCHEEMGVDQILEVKQELYDQYLENAEAAGVNLNDQ